MAEVFQTNRTLALDEFNPEMPDLLTLIGEAKSVFVKQEMQRKGLKKCSTYSTPKIKTDLGNGSDMEGATAPSQAGATGDRLLYFRRPRCGTKCCILGAPLL